MSLLKANEKKKMELNRTKLDVSLKSNTKSDEDFLVLSFAVSLIK